LYNLSLSILAQIGLPLLCQKDKEFEKRASVCGVSVDEVRKGVKAIMLAGTGGRASPRAATLKDDAILAREDARPPETFEASRRMAMEVLKRGQWPKFYFTKNGKGGHWEVVKGA
jgi:adenine-specific DNA-methyltransferase